MTDIVQLKDGATLLYPKTHVKAVDGLVVPDAYTKAETNDLLVKKQDIYPKDTGWLVITQSLYARYVNGRVEINGMMEMGAGAVGTNLSIALPAAIPKPPISRLIYSPAVNNNQKGSVLILRPTGVININNGQTTPVKDLYSVIDSYTP